MMMKQNGNLCTGHSMIYTCLDHKHVGKYIESPPNATLTYVGMSQMQGG